MTIKALVICERSQILTEQLRRFGIEAYSLDIDASYCKDESMHQYHIESCYKEFLEYRLHEIDPDVIYAFTPCIYLSNAGLKHYSLKHNPLEKVNARKEKREEDLAWFLHLLENQYATHMCLENPVGYVNSHVKPSQVVHPHFFGARHNKRTCLWMKNLPTLKRTHYIKDEDIIRGWVDKQGGSSQAERSRRRSKLDSHFAYQIARQHSQYLKAIYR
tara:strand:- start:632 stop:1282 length:651 start_codon:yes stop_codon:yes gene_type:complete